MAVEHDAIPANVAPFSVGQISGFPSPPSQLTEGSLEGTPKLFAGY